MRTAHQTIEPSTQASSLPGTLHCTCYLLLVALTGDTCYHVGGKGVPWCPSQLAAPLNRTEVGKLGYQAGTMAEHSGKLAFHCLSFSRLLPKPLKHAGKAWVLTIGIRVPRLLICHDPGCGIIDLSRDREEG